MVSKVTSSSSVQFVDWMMPPSMWLRMPSGLTASPLLTWQMNHCEASVVITDREFAPVMDPALRALREEFGRVGAA